MQDSEESDCVRARELQQRLHAEGQVEGVVLEPAPVNEGGVLLDENYSVTEAQLEVRHHAGTFVVTLELAHEVLGPQKLADHFDFVLVVALLAQLVFDQVHELECLMVQHGFHALSLFSLQILHNDIRLALRVPTVTYDLWQVDEHYDFVSQLQFLQLFLAGKHSHEPLDLHDFIRV